MMCEAGRRFWHDYELWNQPCPYFGVHTRYVDYEGRRNLFTFCIAHIDLLDGFLDTPIPLTPDEIEGRKMVRCVACNDRYFLPASTPDEWRCTECESEAN